jgi:hypothetical protein
MRKQTLLILAIIASSGIMGQNLQLHYDLGKDRNYFTSTFELFKPDTLGSTYMFIDIDYAKSHGGASIAYGEIARKFTLHKKSGLALQIEYNDGTPSFIHQAFLGGFSYPVKIGKFTLHTSLLYKAFQDAKSADGQITLVWMHMLFNSRIMFTGFVDVWSQDKFMGSGKDIVFLSEPQLWYKINRGFKVGGEVEFSRNFFVSDNEFKCMPTIAVRYDF